MSNQAKRNTFSFLQGIHGNILRGNGPSIIVRVRGVSPQVVALIRKDPEFAAYMDQLLSKVERGNYAGINAGNFNRRATAASATVARFFANENARVAAADAARLKRTRNAANAAAKAVRAARNAVTAAGANRAAKRAANNAAAAARAASETTGGAAAAREAANAARKAAMNARAAERLAEARAAREARERTQSNFNANKARWEANFTQRLAGGRTVRQVIHNMAHQHLGVNIPVNGNITKVHRARIHPNKGRNKALRTVLYGHLP